MTPTARYLDLLKACLTRTLWAEDALLPPAAPPARFVTWLASREGLTLCRREPYQAELRRLGRENPDRLPAGTETMIGRRRLDHLQACVERVLEASVPGDLVETGVWRGGASVLMRAVLAAHGVTDRVLWCADSFQGLPAPDVAVYPADAPSVWHTMPVLAVPLEQVQATFARYGLLDGQVRFLVGWFKDTLPTAPIGQIAVLRLDGDLYESTTDALTALYPKLSPGGVCIIDDYGIQPDMCKQAVHAYRAQHGITEPIEDIDGWGVCWWKR